MQFVRYAELVKQQGATVVVECRPPLVRLLARCPGVDRVVATFHWGIPLPDDVPQLAPPVAEPQVQVTPVTAAGTLSVNSALVTPIGPELPTMTL